MARKSRNPNFDQALEILRAHSFGVAPFAGVAGGVLVTKYGAGAVLVPGPVGPDPVAPGRPAAVAFYERLGYEIDGEPFTEVGLAHRRMRKALAPEGELTPE